MEIHKSLLRHQEENVRFNEMIIELYQKMEKQLSGGQGKASPNEKRI